MNLLNLPLSIASKLKGLTSNTIEVKNPPTTPVPMVNLPQPPVAQPPTSVEIRHKYPRIDMQKLAFAESSGNPQAQATGIDNRKYKGLAGMGEDAWNEANVIRQRNGLTVYPYSMVNDPKANLETADTYLHERIPEILISMGKKPTVERMLAYYGGWWNDWVKAGGVISKMPKSAQTYFKNVLGPKINPYRYK